MTIGYFSAVNVFCLCLQSGSTFPFVHPKCNLTECRQIRVSFKHFISKIKFTIPGDVACGHETKYPFTLKCIES